MSKYSKPLSAYASTLPAVYVTQPHTLTHMHTYGGAAQLEAGYLTVSASWPSALNCNLCNHAAPTV